MKRAASILSGVLPGCSGGSGKLYGGYIRPDSTLHEMHLIASQWDTDTDWPSRAMQFVTGVE